VNQLHWLPVWQWQQCCQRSARLPISPADRWSSLWFCQLTDIVRITNCLYWSSASTQQCSPAQLLFETVYHTASARQHHLSTPSDDTSRLICSPPPLPLTNKPYHPCLPFKSCFINGTLQMLFTYLTEMLRIQTRKSITRGGGPVITCLFNKNCEEMNVITWMMLICCVKTSPNDALNIIMASNIVTYIIVFWCRTINDPYTTHNVTRHDQWPLLQSIFITSLLPSSEITSERWCCCSTVSSLVCALLSYLHVHRPQSNEFATIWTHYAQPSACLTHEQCARVCVCAHVCSLAQCPEFCKNTH